MFSIAHLLIGIVMAGVGLAGVKWTYPIMNFTGRQDWLERFTGQGTTYLAMKLFFVFVLLFGVLYATGLGSEVINWALSPLRHIFAPTYN